MVVTLAVLTAIVLLWQGIYVFRTGTLAPFFMDYRDMHPGVLVGFRRWLDGGAYMVAAACVVFLLAFAAEKRGLRSLLGWVESNGGMLFWLLLFGVVGLLY